MTHRSQSALARAPIASGAISVMQIAHMDARSRRFWLCKCVCGKEFLVRVDKIAAQKSCGCLRPVPSTLSHRGTHTPEYEVWKNMLQRCGNPKNPRYPDYGGRGIAVCDRWLKFDNFLADMGLRPNPELTIERINNELGYQPGNCKWATRSEQQRNKRKKRCSR